MFEASLLVCLAISPETCKQLNDTKGPYNTENECKARVDEMAAFATEANLFELDIKWKCDGLKGLKVRFYEPSTSTEAKRTTAYPTTRPFSRNSL